MHFKQTADLVISMWRLERNALKNNTNGGYNVAMGSYALYFNTTGSENVAIGYGAGGASAAPNDADFNVAMVPKLLIKNTGNICSYWLSSTKI